MKEKIEKELYENLLNWTFESMIKWGPDGHCDGHDIILYGILKILGYDDIPLEFNPRWYSKQEIDSAIKNVLEKGEI